MEPELEAELREAGDELRASHDEDVIRSVIEEVEGLEDDEADKTAGLLRFMTGIEAE